MVLQLWHIWCISGALFFLVEIFTPALFFLNLGFACFISAICAALGLSFTVQVIVFAVFSAIFLIFLRPLLIKTKKVKDTEFSGKYIGETAKVIETIDENGGRISIYGEEWQAKSVHGEHGENGEVIEKGKTVKIVKNESIIMYVRAE